jgi:hypothetical protein
MEKGKRDRETWEDRLPTQRAGRTEAHPAARGADGETGGPVAVNGLPDSSSGIPMLLADSWQGYTMPRDAGRYEQVVAVD